MSKETKVTAVEWLIEQLILKDRQVNPNSFTIQIYFEANKGVVQQAQAIEKQQIIDAYSADRFPCSEEDAEQYYTETYGN